MRKICAKFVPRVLREDQKERRCHDSREMVELINSDPTVLDALVTCDESWIYCYDPETKRLPSGSMLGFPDPRRPDKSTHKLLMIPFFDCTSMIYMHWVPTGQTLNKEYYVEVLMESRKRFRRKRPALFKSGQWHFHQDNAPVHNSIADTIWPRWASRQFPSLPLVQTLVPVTFCYSLSSESVVMRQLRRWKRLRRRSLTRSHKRTSMGPSRSCWNGRTSALQPEEITSKGLGFHVYTINKSGHTKKVWKLIEGTSYSHVCVCVWVYLFIHIYASICVWICIFVNLCMYVCMYVYMCVYLYMYIYMCVDFCIYIYIYICVCVCVCMFGWVCIWLCVCVWIYIFFLLLDRLSYPG